LRLRYFMNTCVIISLRNGIVPTPGVSDDCDGKELFPSCRAATAHPTGGLVSFAASRSGVGRKTDRPLRQGDGVDRRRAHGPRICAAVRKLAPGAREFAGGAAGQIVGPAG